MGKDFTHLHVHTEYSLLDGVNKSYSLVEKVKDSGMNAIAITDHGVLYGIPEFWKASKDFDVKPILGSEIYLSPKKHTIKQPINGIKYYHLVLLAKNIIGYKNLVKLTSIAHLEGFYYKPRVDIETLKKYSEGIICTSACLASPISRHILRGQEKQAEEWLQKLHSIFKDDFYLELQRHVHAGKDEFKESFIKQYDEDTVDLIKKQIVVNKKIREYSEKYNIPLIATTDAHYLEENDKDVQGVLFCIKDGLMINDPRARQGYAGTYIKTPEEMYEVYADDTTPLENTMIINEKIEKVELHPDRVQPQYWNLPKEKTSREELKDQTMQGAKQKFGDPLPPEILERLETELHVIGEMGYNDYFLVVGDIMQFARRNEIVVGVRGSAAGSLVSYCLEITNVNPLQWGLVFERFLNLERASPPDIDLDIQDDRREELIQYARDKYGENSVAGIITFGKMATKAAIRDAARVMGIDLAVADKLSKMVTVLFGRPYSWDQMIETDAEFKQIVESDPQLQELGEVVKKIEGLNRHTGVHAAGYLITPGPIDEYMAYQKDPNDENLFVTQMDGNWIDKLDYMKFDFLGLRTLTIIKNTILYIRERHGIDIDLSDINVNPTQGEFDEKALEVFRTGNTVGVFQFESPPMQKYLMELKPQNLADICFMAAAYRPGPMQYIPDYIAIRNNEKQAKYAIAELEPILEDTLGFPVYQEQLLKICQKLGGFTLGDGDIIRNALKKKQLDILKAKEKDFKKYFLENYEYGKEVADEIWGQLEPFASYGFNKAHASSYAAVAYWCAYLKGNYPLEFVTALMHSDLENSDRIVIDINDAKRLGFEVLAPDINESGVYFKPEGDKSIRFGLGAIKNVGVKVCQKIVSERDKNGNYTSFDDLIIRVGTSNITKKVAECLIKVGALDTFGSRSALLLILQEVFENAASHEKNSLIGQSDLFSVFEDANTVHVTSLPNVEAESDAQKVTWEKELIGIFISSHPLDSYNWISLTNEMTDIQSILELPSDKKIKTIAIASNIKLTHTKADGKRMALCSLEDKTGSISSVLFPRTYEQYGAHIEESVPLIVEATINERDGEKSLIVSSLERIEAFHPPKRIELSIVNVTNKEKLSGLKSLFENGGDLEVTIHYGSKSNPKKIKRYTKLTEENIDIMKPWVKTL